MAVAEKLSALPTADYFTARAARADIPKALKVLKRAGVGKPPKKGDELPPRKKESKTPSGMMMQAGVGRVLPVRYGPLGADSYSKTAAKSFEAVGFGQDAVLSQP